MLTCSPKDCELNTNIKNSDLCWKYLNQQRIGELSFGAFIMQMSTDKVKTRLVFLSTAEKNAEVPRGLLTCQLSCCVHC